MLSETSRRGSNEASSTFLASMGRILWRAAEANNVDAAQLFVEVGMDPNQIEAARARFPFALVCDGWLSLAARTENAFLGLDAARHYRIPDFHALGITFLASANLIEALRRIDRYEKVINSSVDYDIVERELHVDFICTTIDLPERATRVLEDLRHSIVVSLAREGIGRHICPAEVGFTYHAPLRIDPLAEYFGCPVEFDAPHSYLRFNKSDALLAFTARNSDLAREGDLILDKLLASLDERDYVSQVKQLIARALPSGTPAEQTIAAAMLTSSRTLHRRLAESDTTFRDMLAQVRQELAEGYLKNESMPITEICYLVGYADVSTFSRAFKRWTGNTPAEYRAG